MPSFLPKPPSPVLQRSDPLARGLVAAFPFSEGAGTTVHDLSGHNNHATFSGTVTWAAGPFGDSININSATSFAGVSPPPLSGTITNFSIWGWAYRALTSQTLAIGITDALARDVYILVNQDANVYFVVSNGSLAYGFVPSALTGWHFYCLTFAPNLIKGYIDGVQKSLMDDGTTWPANYAVTSTDTFRIGYDLSQNKSSTGNFDAVGVANRTLSASEIAQLYQDPFRLYRPRSRLWEYAVSAPVVAAIPRIFVDA